jgi:hypothetical protein
LVWSSPLAAAWTTVDAPALVRLARLLDRVERDQGAPAQLCSEIRQLEDRFGLSPLARRRLAWELKPAEGDERPTEGRQDERWLRAVSG